MCCSLLYDGTHCDRELHSAQLRNCNMYSRSRSRSRSAGSASEGGEEEEEHGRGGRKRKSADAAPDAGTGSEVSPGPRV